MPRIGRRRRPRVSTDGRRETSTNGRGETGRREAAAREPSTLRQALSSLSLSPIIRHWWIPVVGVVAAIAVGVVAAKAKEAPYQYTASAQFLVTSTKAPYFRTSITTEEMRPAGADNTETVLNTNPPDTDTLVRAANLYPVLITSDPVTTQRREMFGPATGTLDARAIFSVQTASRFQESSIPVIEVNATSGDPNAAITLADQTIAAFTTWIGDEQAAAKVDEDQRILIQPLASAHVVTTTGGPSYGIPVLLGLAVFLAFCGLAFVIDSLARGARRNVPEEAPEPAAPKQPHEGREAGSSA